MATKEDWTQLSVDEGIATYLEYPCMERVQAKLAGTAPVLFTRGLTPQLELPGRHDAPTQYALALAADPGQPAVVPPNDLDTGTGGWVGGRLHGMRLPCRAARRRRRAGAAWRSVALPAGPCVGRLRVHTCAARPLGTPHRPPPNPSLIPPAGTTLDYVKPAALMRSYDMYLTESAGGKPGTLRAMLSVSV